MSLATDLSDGIGGLKFVATAPPGVGRLCRIPFYKTSVAAVGNFLVAAPASAPVNGSATSPAIIAASNAAGISATILLSTPQISWATLRIVGFEVSINAPLNQATGNLGEVVVQDLKIGGGANLFVHEDFAPANIYASGNDSFSGLRDYPLLKSPNVAQVTMAVAGALATGTAAAAANTGAQMQTQQLVCCNLVVEILQDDNYGSHIPGPYARKGAMVRRGGSLV
jgi:hypothetical protein